MVWVSTYGKGRVCENVMGHDVLAMQDAGFQTLLIRGVEWVGTGQVHYPVPKELTKSKEWVGLATMGMVTRCYTINGEEYSDVRYYISSLKMGVKQFARAVRQHWGTENGQHWTLDMTFREDESRIRGKQVRENFAWLNRLALSLLQQHPEKASIAMKRQSCGWDDNYLLQVLTGIVG